MTPLTEPQKKLIFDYTLGLTSQQDSVIAGDLIASNPQAAELCAALKAALSPLESLEEEACPDSLAEAAVSRLNECAHPETVDITRLLAAEQKHTAAGGRFWPKAGQILATAAAIVFVSGVMLSSLNFARQKSWQQQCQMQLSNIWTGVNNYRADNDGSLPSVATSAGAPWWKVGRQGGENHSNTRHMWLLVKGGYSDASDFVCPAHSKGRLVKIDPARINNYNDFPARKYVHYSFRIMCDKSKKTIVSSRQVLMADMNPLFEKLPDSNSIRLKLRINNKLLSRNSINHRRRGQNVLFCDGSVKFVKIRHIGITQDDIFTLQDVSFYEGVEVPSCAEDSFLAP